MKTRALLILFLLLPATSLANDKATFAGGCFWCMESLFQGIKGVISATSGYTGGQKPFPTYEEVSSGTTGHYEAIEIIFDPTQVSYETLLNSYWHNVDPLDLEGQFCDKGEQYRSAIFYHSETQRKLAEQSKDELQKSGKFSHPIGTEIRPAVPFYPAEEYHQDFYLKNPRRYESYRYSCGRDSRLNEVWGSIKK